MVYTCMYVSIKLSAFLILILIPLTLLHSLEEVTYTTTLLYLDDPEGDDKGPGTYLYPTAGDFAPHKGLFDLKRFEVEVNETNVLFRIYLANLGGNRWNGVSGFSFQYIQIYVKTTLDLGELRKDTFGLNVELNPGWHFAILAIGGWAQSPFPVPQGEYPALWRIDKAAETLTPGKDIYADLRENVIVINVSKNKLLDVENYDKWLFAVFVTSYDGYNTAGLRVRAVNDTQGPWVIGGGDPDAIKAGVEPRVMDLLARTEEDQYNILKGYNATANKIVVVPMIELDKMEVTRTKTITPSTTPQQTTQTTETTGITTPITKEPYFYPAPQNPGPSPEVVIVVFVSIAVAFIIVAVIIANIVRRR